MLLGSCNFTRGSGARKDDARVVLEFRITLCLGKLLFSRCNLYMSCHYHTCPSCNVTNIDRASPSHGFDAREKIGVVFILAFGHNLRSFHYLRSCICVHRYRTSCADTSGEFNQNFQGIANNHHKSSSKLAFEVLVDGRYRDVDG